MKLSDFLFGKKGKYKQVNRFTPQQQQLFDLISKGLTQGVGELRDIFGPFNQQEFEKGVTDPALKQFREKVLPNLYERYIAGNQVGGSGMRMAGDQAATDLQSQLSQLLYQAQQDQRSRRQQGVGLALGVNPTETTYRPPTQGFVSSILEGASPMIGKQLGTSGADLVSRLFGRLNPASDVRVG